MKICLDARSPYGGGITTYTQELLKNLLANDKANKYIILYDAKYGRTGFLNTDERIAPSSNRALSLVWDHTFLPFILKKERVDIYHSFKRISSFKSETKLIYTIHAAALCDFPQLREGKTVFLYDWMMRRLGRNASRLISLSEADKDHLASFYGVDQKKIKVTYLAADNRFYQLADKTSKERIRLRYNLPQQFILYVGIPHPIKNVHTLIKAYSIARYKLKTPHKLVIIGQANITKYQIQLQNLVKALKMTQSVIFPGYIKDELPIIYNLADLFVFPSLCESFALPPMEALACGTPVIASRVGGIPEIYADAVVLIDPTDVEGLAEAMVDVLSSDQMRAEMRRKGLERSQLFSWKRCASETIKIYEDVFTDPSITDPVISSSKID